MKGMAWRGMARHGAAWCGEGTQPNGDQMRRAARTDDNQQEIVRVLTGAGCSVVSLAAVGAGVPDLLVGYQGRNYLLEVKDGAKPPSASKLNARQVDWHRKWHGHVAVVRCVGAALDAVGIKEWTK